MNNSEYMKYKEIVEQHLVDLLPEVDHKSVTVYASMSYSLMAGGKRIRPTLLMGACEFSGGKTNMAIPYACAVEFVHTYSLIHDDLPAMDDDSLRRGKPTNHKIYGEAMAILAGDGLLNSAYEIMDRDKFLYFDNMDELKKRICASYEIIKGAGCLGMIAGQVADIEAEGKNCSKEMLDYIHLNKTGSLIIAAVRAGAYLGGADEETFQRLTDYAEHLGLAFQIADDILDVKGNEKVTGKITGGDQLKEKATYPSLYGMEASYQKMEDLTENALEIMAPYYDNAEFFNFMVKSLIERVK